MDLAKWMKIYNSIIRFKFYTYLEAQKPNIIEDFDKHYQDFVNTHMENTNNDKVLFFGGDMLIGLCYLVLVRTNEFLKNELDSVQIDKILSIENWELIGVRNLKELENKYDIEIKQLAEKTKKGKSYYSNDSEKLLFFIRKLRNSLGHYRYENPTLDSIKLVDENPNNKITEMECIFKYADFLNFCSDFGILVNDGLYKMFHKE
jgi:hypothetical protein